LRAGIEFQAKQGKMRVAPLNMDINERPVSSSSRIGRIVVLLVGLIWIVAIACLWWTLTPMPSHLLSNLLASYLLVWGGIAIIGRRPGSEVRKRFALMTSAIGLTLAGIELPAMVGMVDYGRLFPSNQIRPLHSRSNIPDPDLLHRRPAYFHDAGWTKGDLIVSTFTRVSSAPAYHYDVSYDRNGFRNATDLNQAEIAVVGDSFIEGGLVAYDSLMTSVLGRLRKCTVANLGQSQYGPRQERVVLERYAAPLKPRVCVWAFFEGNDLGDIARYDLVKAHWPPRPEPRSMGDRSFSRNALTAFIRVAGLDKSRYLDFLKRSGTIRTPAGTQERLFFLYPGLPLSADDRTALNKLETILGSASEFCEHEKIRLVVVFIPTKFRVYQDMCTFAVDSPCAGWIRNELPETLRSMVARISPGIGYLDLTGPFREQAATRPLLYFADDTHWSPEGHKLAAELIDKYLSQ
jgi:hypothetical protein